MDIPLDLTNIKIETKRLALRAFGEPDLQDFYAYARVPGVGEMAGWPHHESIQTTQTILNMFKKNKDVFAIYHKADAKVIGSLGLHNNPNSWANKDERYSHLRLKEVGYVLSKDYWGQRLVPEAVKAVIDYGFDKLDLEAFSCAHFVENSQSKRVIEKCGFTYVGEGKYYSKLMDKYFDELTYILLRDKETSQ